MLDVPSRTSGALIIGGLWLTIGYAAAAQGAFYRSQGLFVAGVVVSLAVVAGRRTWAEAALVAAGLILLAVGLGAATLASGWLADALLPAAALASATGAFAAGRGAILRGERHRLLQAMAGVGAGVGLAGMVGVALHMEPLAMQATGLWRASSSITYANGLAAILVLSLPAALLIPHQTWRRASTMTILAGLAATASRGGVIAAAVLAGVLVALGGRSLAVAAVRPAIGAAVTAVGLIPSLSGHQPRPLIAAAGFAIGAAIAMPRRLHHAAWLLIALAAVVALTGPARSLLGIRGARLMESRAAAQDPRAESWRQAAAQGMERPVFGQGPGRYTSDASLFAHNEYLQIFAETGLVGLGSVLAAVGLFAAWALRRRPAGDERLIWAAGVAAGAAFLVHGGVDFVWRFPLAVLLVFLWLALAGTRPKENP